MRIYVASSWRNNLQVGVVASLRAAGHEVYDFKNPKQGDSGFSWKSIDQGWQMGGLVTPEHHARMLEHPIAQAGFEPDMNALKSCEACVLVLPCGRSAHLELGWAAGAGKKTYVLEPDPIEPDLMYLMCDKIFTTFDEMLREFMPDEDDRYCTDIVPPHAPRHLSGEITGRLVEGGREDSPDK